MNNIAEKLKTICRNCMDYDEEGAICLVRYTTSLWGVINDELQRYDCE